MKRKELFWMIVPCLLLVGAGWFIQRQESRKQNPVVAPLSPALAPLSFRIESIVKEPLSAIEIGAGYDNRIAVTVLQGPAQKINAKTRYLIPWAKKVQLLGEKDIKPLDIPIRYEINGKLSARELGAEIGPIQERTRIAFSLSLSKVAQSEGLLTLTGQIEGPVFEEENTKTPYSSTTSRRGLGPYKQVPQPLLFQMPVRIHGEKIAFPLTVMSCPLRLKNCKVQTVGGNVHIRLELNYKDPDRKTDWPHPRFTFEETCLIDATGRKFPLALDWRTRYRFDVDVEPTHSTRSTTYFIRLGIPPCVPEAKGKMILKTLISANGSWPLRFTANVGNAPAGRRHK